MHVKTPPSAFVPCLAAVTKHLTKVAQERKVCWAYGWMERFIRMGESPRWGLETAGHTASQVRKERGKETDAPGSD